MQVSYLQDYKIPRSFTDHFSGAVFPGLVEAIEAKDFENAQKWVGIIGGTLEKAVKGLK